MKQHKTIQNSLILFLLIMGILSQAVMAQQKVTPPEEFFGFRLGSDRNMARWDKIVHYFEVLERETDKIKVVNMGPSTMGHPFLLVIISSGSNLSRLDSLQQINAKISDPRGVTEAEIKDLIKEGKGALRWLRSWLMTFCLKRMRKHNVFWIMCCTS